MISTQVLQGAFPILGTLFVVWLTARFISIRSHQDKVWLRKSDAYGHILEAVTEIRNWYDVNREDEHHSREPDEETRVARDKLFAEARRRLAGTVAREAWLLPESVQQEIERLNLALSERHDFWYGHIDGCYFASNRSRAIIEEIAKEDMKRPAFFSFS